ncbi:hypothetical protein [Endozoicomonas sp. Mp262]|uniref:hypothetical protein n=1 Tax=Endozoicomonas sp. Mp262 TaxID=2919499 RepID=UPI0021D8FE5E
MCQPESGLRELLKYDTHTLLTEAYKLFGTGCYQDTIGLMTHHSAILEMKSDQQYELNYLLLRSYDRAARNFLKKDENSISFFSMPLIYRAYDQINLLRKINPNEVIKHDWREAKNFVLEFEVKRHFEYDIEARFTKLTDKHLAKLHSHVNTLGFNNPHTHDIDPTLQTISYFKKTAEFLQFLNYPEFIMDLHITLSDILLIKAQLSEEPSQLLNHGFRAIACISKMYNYTKTLIASRPEQSHDTLFTLFMLLGIRSDALWRFSELPQIIPNPDSRKKIRDLAVSFHLDLKQARDFYLICIFRHFEGETVTDPNGFLANFWMQLDPEKTAEQIKRNEHSIHEGLERDCQRLETLTLLE